MITTQDMAGQLLHYLSATRGDYEELDLSLDHKKHFLPLLRVAALFWSGSYFTEVLGGKAVSKEEAEEVLRAAHPYFTKALMEASFDWMVHWKGCSLAAR